MPPSSAAETKKAVCRSFTNVVKASRLSGSVDPKAFFMMMNTNFSMLHRDGQIDLAPIWEALAASLPPNALYGVFLKFAESAEQMGLVPLLPSAVAALGDAQKQSELASFSPSGSNGVSEVIGDSGSYPSLDALPVQDGESAALALSTGDLKPFIPEETRRQVTQYVVHAVKAAPVGRIVDAHQLAFLVDSNFEDLFDGLRFDFNPILEGMRELAEFKDDAVYVAVVRLERKLHGMGLELAPVSLHVDPAIAESLLREAEENDRVAAQEAATAVAQTRARTVTQVPEIGEPVPDKETSDAKERRDDKVRAKWGIRSQGLSSKTKAIRYTVLGAIALGVAVVGMATWPNRTLDATDYAASVPLTSAVLREGGLQGILDDAKWWDLSVDERKQRLAAFKTYVSSRGQTTFLQVRDHQDRVVISMTTDGRIVPAKFFVYGTSNGTIPSEFKEELAADAPADARRVIEARKKTPEKKAEDEEPEQEQEAPPPE